MEEEPVSRATSAHAARLERTLEDLQNQVKEQEAALEKIRASSTPIQLEPSPNPAAHLQQLRRLRSVYKSLTPKEPYLPPGESQLPALLALRTTHRTIEETKTALITSQTDLARAEKLLQKEISDLENAKLITQALEERIGNLETMIQQRTQQTPSQIAKDMIRELKRKQDYYETATGKLVKSFNEFIDDHLAAMLAAEELGGPVVGELLEIEERNLEAGFNTQGKARKPKQFPNEDKRQRRIDEIWGQRRSPEGGQIWNEKAAAGAEMRELTENLLNSSVEAEGGGTDEYVELDRESAAARFLVRSKVAQFHPKDARKLRLIDFGRDLED